MMLGLAAVALLGAAVQGCTFPHNTANALYYATCDASEGLKGWGKVGEGRRLVGWQACRSR